jgi:hypothetical protein
MKRTTTAFSSGKLSVSKIDAMQQQHKKKTGKGMYECPVGRQIRVKRNENNNNRTMRDTS